MMPENIGYGATTKSRIIGKTCMSLHKVVVLKQRVGSLVRGGATAGDMNLFVCFYAVVVASVAFVFEQEIQEYPRAAAS